MSSISLASSPAGFQASEGAMGSVATAAASSAMWITGRSAPPGSFFSRKCA